MKDDTLQRTLERTVVICKEVREDKPFPSFISTVSLNIVNTFSHTQLVLWKAQNSSMKAYVTL